MKNDPEEDEGELNHTSRDDQQQAPHGRTRPDHPCWLLSSVSSSSRPPPPPSTSSNGATSHLLSSSGVLESIHDDVLIIILLFLDLPSVIRLCTLNKHWNRRLLLSQSSSSVRSSTTTTTSVTKTSSAPEIYSSAGNGATATASSVTVPTNAISNWTRPLWRVLYERMYFSWQDTDPTKDDYLRHCQYRVRLERNLFQPPKQFLQSLPPPNHYYQAPVSQIMPRTSTPRRQHQQHHLGCFNVPLRFMRFWPILPDTDDEEYWSNLQDPPPVVFDCDSVALCSTATSSEVVLLNPFTGTLNIYHSLLSLCISDCLLNPGYGSNYQHEYQDLSQLLGSNRSSPTMGGPLLKPHQCLLHQQQLFSVDLAPYFASSHVTVRPEDEIQVEVSFLGLEVKPILQYGRKDRNDNCGGGDSGNYSYYDSHPYPVGSMILVGRALCNDPEPWQQELQCFELMAWFRWDHHYDERQHPPPPTKEDQRESPTPPPPPATATPPPFLLYADPHTLRFREDFYAMDVCPIRRLVYVNHAHLVAEPRRAAPDRHHHHHEQQHRHRHQQQQQQQNQPLTGAQMWEAGSSVITVYPLIPTSTTTSITTTTTTTTTTASPDDHRARGERSYLSYPSADTFPSPLGMIHSTDRISSLAICPTGDQLVLSTVTGCILFYKLHHSHEQYHHHYGSLEQTPLSAQPPSSPQQQLPQQQQKQTGPNHELASLEHTLDVARCLQQVLTGQRQEEWVQQLLTLNRPAHTIVMPQGKSIQLCGFCTLHTSRYYGSVILLWQHQQPQQLDGRLPSSSGGTSSSHHHRPSSPWTLPCMVRLPLSNSRLSPLVHYDGRRLVVFGKDHIGFIVLIYQVSHGCPVAASNNNSNNNSQEESGGVIQLIQPETTAPCDGATTTTRTTNTITIRLANRIRNAALGGLPDYERLQMTCNERFLIFNTKTANLVWSCHPEGLLVIDLDEECDN